MSGLWPGRIRKATLLSGSVGRMGRSLMPPTVLALPMLLTFLAGCTCQPLLDVDACFDDRRDCTAAKQVVTWDADLAERWPDLDAILQDLPEGEHHHQPWHGDGDALLADLSANMERRTAWVEHEGRLYRVRQPVC